jgi:hypothetical protein
MNVVYNIFKKQVLDNSIDLINDDINIILVSATYTPDESHNYYSDIYDEISGVSIGYDTSGIALTSKGVYEDDANSRAILSADDPIWSASTIDNAKGAVLYKVESSDTTSPLITYIDFGTTKTSENGDFKVQFNSEGIMYLT